MFDNVLVGVDGRSGGRDAIALAARLERAAGEADARPRAWRRAAPRARDYPRPGRAGARGLQGPARPGARRGRARLRARRATRQRRGDERRPGPAPAGRAAGRWPARGRLLRPWRLWARDARRRHPRSAQRRPVRGGDRRPRLCRPPARGRADHADRRGLQRVGRGPGSARAGARRWPSRRTRGCRSWRSSRYPPMRSPA